MMAELLDEVELGHLRVPGKLVAGHRPEVVPLDEFPRLLQANRRRDGGKVRSSCAKRQMRRQLLRYLPACDRDASGAKRLPIEKTERFTVHHEFLDRFGSCRGLRT